LETTGPRPGERFDLPDFSIFTDAGIAYADAHELVFSRGSANTTLKDCVRLLSEMFTKYVIFRFKMNDIVYSVPTSSTKDQ